MVRQLTADVSKRFPVLPSAASSAAARTPQPAAQGESGLTGRSTRLLSTATVVRLPRDRETGEGEGSGRGGLVVRGSSRACSPINEELALPALRRQLQPACNYRATGILVYTAARASLNVYYPLIYGRKVLHAACLRITQLSRSHAPFLPVACSTQLRFC